jgi:hypothetical protein
MPPLRLSDDQLDIIRRAAEPLNPHDRGAYLETVAELLNGHELGDGIVARAAREAQRRFWRAPELPANAGLPKWARKGRRTKSVTKPRSSDGTLRGNSACATLEKEVLVASGDIGHRELDWTAAIGGKPCFVIRHCEDLTVPTDKNVNVRTDTFNRPFSDEASNAAAKHFRPHTQSAHFRFQ